MTVKTDYFPLGEGLDVSTPALSAAPGSLLSCSNFAPDIHGGYRYSGQYERFDGRPSPSDAVYYTLEVADESSYSAGDSITGGTSGATATVAATATGELIITRLVGGFTAAESIGATTVTVVEVLSGESDPTTDATYNLAAADEYRGDIAAVPGSGAIRGIWRHGAKTYAFRDNAGATALDVYKASATGWTQVILSSHYIWYDAGVSAFAEGDSVTGLTSAATGTVHRVVIHTGSYTTGYIVLTGVTGTFSNNEALQVSAVTVATADGASVAVAFAVGGAFQFRSHNFLGTSSSYYVYGCDGVNPAFEIDDSDVFSPIFMPTFAGAPSADTPHLVEIHKGHLFLAFPNGIIEHSTPTDAMTFDAFLGAAEFGMSDDVTGILSVAGGVLVIFTRSRTQGLYGTNVSDWSMVSLSDNTGALLYGAVPIGRVYAWDDRGIVRLDRVQAFGDFQSASVSKRIQQALIDNAGNLVASVVYKDRDQFWYVLSTGEVVVCYVGEQGEIRFGWLNTTLVVNCAYNAPDENGAERIFIGDDGGFVYEMNKGTSHDGAAMDYGFRTTYNHFRSPRLRKSFKHLQAEISATDIAVFSIAAEYDYSSAYAENNIDLGVSVVGGAGFWNEAQWNEFTWSAQDVPTSEISITGTGINIGLIIYGNSNIIKPFTLQGFMTHYIPRRTHRG